MNTDQNFTIRNILVVDDEPSNCISLEAFLEDAGFHITIAHDGQEALDHISIVEPDMVILDLYMPGMNGHELLRHLTASHPKMPKLVVSGIGEHHIENQIFQEGAWGYVQKPIHDMSTLLQKISLLEGKARQLLQNAPTN